MLSCSFFGSFWSWSGGWLAPIPISVPPPECDATVYCQLVPRKTKHSCTLISLLPLTMAKIIQLSILLTASVHSSQLGTRWWSKNNSEACKSCQFSAVGLKGTGSSCSSLVPSDPWGKPPVLHLLHTWLQTLLLVSPVYILSLTTALFGLNQFISHSTNLIS